MKPFCLLSMILLLLGVQSKDISGTWVAKRENLWAHADRGTFMEEYSAEAPSHGVVLVKVTRSSQHKSK